METPSKRTTFLIALAIACAAAAYALRPASRFQIHGSSPRMYLLDSWTGAQWLLVGDEARRVTRYGPPRSQEELEREAQESYREALYKANAASEADSK